MRTATTYVPMPYGAEEIMTTVEASVHRGLPEFRIVGLPDRALREAAVRVKSAILASGFTFPRGRVVVNIGPANLPKSGTRFDLGIALAILMAESETCCNVACIGELSLTGQILPTNLCGAYSMPWLANSQSPEGFGANTTSLGEAWKAACAKEWVDYAAMSEQQASKSAYAIDAIRGNGMAKRALFIALAGKHNLLLSGPPGSGKTMLAEASAELLPVPDRQVARSIGIVHSQARLAYAPTQVPYLSPHHQLTTTQLLGQKNPLVPGALCLAHGGVLFLDEFPYMRAETLHALREPMQSGQVRLGAHGEVALPASPVIIAARNLCACGKQGMPGETCLCTPHQRLQYEKRVDAALLDRFALHITMSYQEADPAACGAAYAVIIARVHQQKMTVEWASSSLQVLEQYALRLQLSFRGTDQVRAVAETIARIEDCSEVLPEHVQEAMQYRVRKV